MGPPDWKTFDINCLSQQSPSQKSTFFPVISAMPTNNVRSLRDKLSTIDTSYPDSINSTTVCAPMYPAPPVTRTFFINEIITVLLFCFSLIFPLHHKQPRYE